MKYLTENQNAHRDSCAFLEQITAEVNGFFMNFKDSSEHTSRWAHHYFCKEEGGLLEFDLTQPRLHRCSICGKENSSDLLDGVWWTMYRNYGVTQTWKSALLFRNTQEWKYLDNTVNFARFYSDNYTSFTLHNKEGIESETVESAPWGSARIMPQALNESIFIVRLINALELVKEELAPEFIEELQKNIFQPVYALFRPQVREIHNISNWLDCGIAIMGLFLGDKDMVDFAFNSEFGIIKQLEKGVTSDGFWYEGSIHYNMFLLEGLVNVMLFAEIYGHESESLKNTVNSMLITAYSYAFENHQLPNPNDGWPDVNLKTYSYIYSIAVKVLGQSSELGKILGSILHGNRERGTIPLSKPYYFQNDVSLEEFLFVPELREAQKDYVPSGSILFKNSYYGLLKIHGSNIFLKYGHNGPSHAHPDTMNIEVILKDRVLSRDLSNSGYGNRFCNEWHRVSASHNTVVVNGRNHSGYGGGTCNSEDKSRISVTALDVYPGVEFTRELQLNEDGFQDKFYVTAQENSTFDYFFHIEGELDNPSSLSLSSAELGYKTNGYQHFQDIQKVSTEGPMLLLDWKVRDLSIECRIPVEEAEVFLMKSPDNPVVNHRSTLLIRKHGEDANFRVDWQIRDNK